jgi:hypothetical protein
VVIFIDPSSVQITTVSALTLFFGSSYKIVLGLLVASVMSMVGITIDKSWSGILLIPQQVILLLSASGALSAMFLGHFADGVERSRAFILADQCHIVLAAIFHTLALILFVRWKMDVQGNGR